MKNYSGNNLKIIASYRCPLALENNLSIIGTATRNNCIVTPPLLANYNLEWYHYSKRAIQMLRG